MLKENKPLGFICIAPVLLARSTKHTNKTVKITIGNDKETANQIEKLGSQHKVCPIDDFIVDEGNKIVSTSAYMLAGKISEAASGIEILVYKILNWA